MKEYNKADLYYASAKEEIQLKNEVQTKGLLGYKKRYGVLTNERLLLYETKQDYLVKKNPRVKSKILIFIRNFLLLKNMNFTLKEDNYIYSKQPNLKNSN
jgi:hypothetical protein